MSRFGNSINIRGLKSKEISENRYISRVLILCSEKKMRSIYAESGGIKFKKTSKRNLIVDDSVLNGFSLRNSLSEKRG